MYLTVEIFLFALKKKKTEYGSKQLDFLANKAQVKSFFNKMLSTIISMLTKTTKSLAKGSLGSSNYVFMITQDQYHFQKKCLTVLCMLV